MMSDYEEILKSYDIRITALRLEILREMKNFEYAFSLADLEAKLYTFDKSTLFRTIETFQHAGLLHPIDDGEGRTKYCISNLDGQVTNEFHAHITCTRCGRTFCLHGQKIPNFSIPEGFKVEQMSFIIKGICLSCSNGHPCDMEHLKKWKL